MTELPEEVRMEIEQLVLNEYPITDKDSFLFQKIIERERAAFKQGIKLYTLKWLEEKESHEKTKVELESARQLCRTYSEAIVASNKKSFGIMPPEQF